MPEHVIDRTVEVLLELPGEARLADAGDADDRDEVRLPFLRRAVEVLLHEAQLSRPADERRLELARGPRASADRGDSESPEERERLGLALQLVLARRLVRDRRRRGAPGRIADEDGSRSCRSLDAGRRVDEVARDHALALGSEADGRLTGEHAGAQRELGRADLFAERGDR